MKIDYTWTWKDATHEGAMLIRCNLHIITFEL